MLTSAEQSVLDVFRQYLVTQGEMLCFHGPMWEKHKTSLGKLTDRNMLVKEQFEGGYCLTETGFLAMKRSTSKH
jgi:hypothetical protein